MTEVVHSEGDEAHYVCDRSGNLVEVSNETTAVEFERDPLGWATSSTCPFGRRSSGGRQPSVATSWVSRSTGGCRVARGTTPTARGCAGPLADARRRRSHIEATLQLGSKQMTRPAGWSRRPVMTSRMGGVSEDGGGRGDGRKSKRACLGRNIVATSFRVDQETTVQFRVLRKHCCRSRGVR